MTVPAVKLVWPVAALLGEGPVWLADRGELWFVDIHGGRLHRYRPDSGERTTLNVGGKPSFVVPTAEGELVVGSGHALHRLAGERLGPALVTLDMPPGNRTNDATVDREGRLWFGTMDEAERAPTGAFYCLDGAGLHAMGGAAVVTNGPAVTAEGRHLYSVDSSARRIWRHTIAAGPALEDAELFVELGAGEGHPDGVVLDSADCLWVALWDGGAVRRYSPAGDLLLTVPLPCRRVTKLAFGGPDLMTAYVTTARTGLSDAEFAAQPLAGSLFSFPAPVPGRPLPPARLPHLA